MNYLTILMGIAGVHVLAIASPGPTLAAVLSYAVKGNRRAGLQLAFGVVLATMAWATAAAAGLNTALARFPPFYRALQLAGAAYLIFLAIKLFVSVYRGDGPSHGVSHTQTVSGWQAVRAGFLTNIMNPKVIAYYASLFGVLIPSTAPAWLFRASVVVVIIVSGLWWTGVSLVLTNSRVRRGYERAQPILDGLMGVVLVALGLKLAVLG